MQSRSSWPAPLGSFASPFGVAVIVPGGGAGHGSEQAGEELEGRAPTNEELRPSVAARESCPHLAARIDWACLLRRPYLVDVLACPCGGRRRVVADVTDRDAIVAILSHLGLDPDAPKLARARDPTENAA